MLTNRFWIKIIVIIIFSFVLVIFSSELYTIEEIEKHASLEEFTTYLNERIPALMKKYDIPGVNIALVQKGETTWSKAYGYADLGEGREMTTDTYCRVESISKSVTAWGVMKLVDQGKIQLDTPVGKYIKNWELPESNFSEENITVRELLSHTAGMPLGDVFERYSPKEEIPSLEDSLSRHAIPMQEPGLSFSYSNTGYNLLELLIEEVTERDFAEYMEKEVFIPLGMYRSSFSWSEEFEPEVPVGYDLYGNPISVYVYSEKASGGLFTSVEDVATFLTAGMTNDSNIGYRVITPQSINELYTPMVTKLGVYSLVFDSYGLGHYIEVLSNGKQAVSHGGQGGGYMTHFHSVPETGDGIVILTNSQRSWPFIAYILSDWAQWSGFSSIGMSKIILGKNLLWILIGLIWFTVLWQACRLSQKFISSRRKFLPLWKEFGILRLVQSGVSIILISSLLWCASQDYLFISSVFPIASTWLGFSILGLAVVLMLAAMFPLTKDKGK